MGMDATIMGLLNRIERLEKALDRLSGTEVTSGGAWTTYAPLVVQGGAVAATVSLARYLRAGKAVHAYCLLGVTAAGTAANAILVTVPAGLPTLSASLFIEGNFVVFDASAGTFYSGPVSPSTTSLLGGVPPGTGGFIGAVGMTAALASGDIIYYAVCYETSA